LSCHRFLANAFRLLLHGFAYNLVNLFRLQLPQPWCSAQIETLRARLFKLGARVRQTARCIRIHLATGWPFQSLFYDVAVAFFHHRVTSSRSANLMQQTVRAEPSPKMPAALPSYLFAARKASTAHSRALTAR
jgi:hypothetical protein